MKCFSCVLLLLGILCLHSVTGYSVLNGTAEDVSVSRAPAEIDTSDSGEPALVQFIGNNDNTTTTTTTVDKELHGVTGFFKKLGCDLVRGTQIVSKSVTETKVWGSVKKGYERLKNLFSKKETPTPVEEEVEKIEPNINVEGRNNQTETVIVSTEAPAPVMVIDTDNEISDPEPEIDVRILGGSGRVTNNLEPVVYKFN